MQKARAAPPKKDRPRRPARVATHAGEDWTEVDDPVALDAGQIGIWHIDSDGLVATTHSPEGGTWAQWQLALAYARHLSLRLHLWCSTVLRAAMARPGGGLPMAADPLILYVTQQFRDLHRRLDTLDRHAADLMFLVLSAQDILLDKRRDFSERSQATIVRVTAAEPFEGQCPCCLREPVLTEAGRPLAPSSTTSSIAA
jgi:hypothetical protein